MVEKKTANKTYKIKFDSRLEDREFIVEGTKLVRLPDNKTVIKEQVIPRLAIKSGQKKEIDQATYDYMIERKLLLTKEEKEEQDVVRKKYGGMKRSRDSATSTPPIMTDEEKKKLVIDKPYVIEE